MSPKKPASASAPPHPMAPALLEAVARRFRALAEPVRLRLLEALCDGPLTVGELAQRFGQSHANTSKHLLVLAAAGFVSRSEQGTRTRYALAGATTERLCALICEHVLRGAEADLEGLRGSP